MKRRLFFALLLVLVVPACSQNVLYEVTCLPSDRSIVREYKENVFVVYNTGANSNSFNLVDLNSMSVNSIDVGPSEVNDFEIYKDIVYFCGKVGSQALVGWFDIPAVFSGMASVRLTYLPSMTCPQNTGYTDYFTNVKKIELMDIGGGMHLLLVGESYCSREPTLATRFFADLFFNGTDWTFEATQEHSAIFYYDDVAVTDNRVVPVGHKNPSNAEYIYSLPKPLAPYVGIFSSISFFPIIFNYSVRAYAGYSCQIIDSLAEIVIEHITGDVFCTAYHGYATPSGGSGYVNGTLVNVYSGGFGVSGRYCVAPYSLKFKDLRYSPMTNSLYLLPGAGSPAPPYEYVELFLNPTHTAVTSVQEHVDMMSSRYSSLDACMSTYGNGQSILSGSNKYLRLWRHDPSTEETCSKMVKIPEIIIDCPDYSDFYMDIYFEHVQLYFGSYSPSLTTYKIIEICKEDENQ